LRWKRPSFMLVAAAMNLIRGMKRSFLKANF
jgi:hypothetical protein